MAPHSSTLAWKIPWMEEPGRLQSMGSLESDTTERLHFHFFIFMHWRRKWRPTPVFLPGNPRGRRALWADVYGVIQSRTRLKWLSSSSSSIMQLIYLKFKRLTFQVDKDMEQLKFYTRLVTNHLIWKARLTQQQKWMGMRSWRSLWNLLPLWVSQPNSWSVKPAVEEEEQGAVWRKEKKARSAGHILAITDEDIRE